MLGKEKTTNFVIKAVKPVPFILSLFQLVGRIIIGGFSLIVVFLVFMMSLTAVETGQLSTGLGGAKDANEKAGLKTITIAGNKKSENKLLELDLSGTILGVPPFPAQDPYLYTMLGVTFGSQLESQIISAIDNESIKGILLHTRTPGGTIHGSQAIHNAIAKYQEKTGKPVVIWIEGFSASGGVYSTASATAIYAAPGSMIGSIGVIGPSIMYYNDPVAIDGGLTSGGVTTRGGIDMTVLHAGKGKDFGNPFRPLGQEEKDVYLEGMTDSYKDFVGHVSRGRGIAETTIVEQLGAYMYGTEKAEEYGLIDATFNRDEAYMALAVLAKLKEGDFAIVRRAPMRGSYFEQALRDSGIETNANNKSSFISSIEAYKCQVARTMPLAYHGSVNSFCGESD
jgi:protease-4